MSDDYELRRLTLDDAAIAECNDLLTRVFVDTDVFSEAFLRWQYVDNPLGPAVGFNAYAGDTLAGHYVTQPVRCMIHGEEQLGLLSLNTATHPDHRYKKLFTRLASRTYEAAAKEGFKFVFGVANEKSIVGLVRYLEFQRVGQIDVEVGVRCEGIASEPPATLSFARCWDRASLRWRLSNPSRDYEVRDGRVYFASGRMGNMPYMLGEFPGLDLTGLPSTPIATRNPLEMFAGFEPGQMWRPPLRLNVPVSLHRKSLTMIFRDLSGAGRVLEPGNIRLRLIDTDT